MILVAARSSLSSSYDGYVVFLLLTNLSECGAEDIGSLRGLTGLTYLDLSGNSISDLSPLSGLTNLTYLKLTGNRIADYSPVEGRSGLTLIR